MYNKKILQYYLFVFIFIYITNLKHNKTGIGPVSCMTQANGPKPFYVSQANFLQSDELFTSCYVKVY